MADATRKIGKYEIVSELGRGAMGVVYKGLDPVINRYVAIKTVARYGADVEGAHLDERFKQEAKAAGRLNHPAIVSVYEYGEEPEQAFIAMEFVDGSTLADLAKRNITLEIQEIWSLMAKVLDGLNYAHSKGIVHRDIKPSNIMRTADGEVKIADFGIARIESSELTQIGTVMGTPGYMSPEQLLGQRVDHRSDIFSCGILLYELLTGERAFASTNITSTIYKVVHTTLPDASKICPTLTEAIDPVLAKAMAKNPNDRFQSAKEFAQAIERVARGETDVVPRAVPPQEDGKTVIRRPQQGDNSTVVVARHAQADNWLDNLGGQPQPEDSDAKQTREASRSTARPRTPLPGTKKLTWAILGAAIIGAVVAAVVLLKPANTSTSEGDRTSQSSASTPAPTESTRSTAATGEAAEVAQPQYAAGATFTDCEKCPKMVVVPPGSFMEGSPGTELGRELNEGPQHGVQIGYPLAVGQYEITRGQFAQFAVENGYDAKGCWIYDGNWRLQNTGSWQSPGFPQTDDHPVTCVSWDDAEAYVGWLSARSGKKYRLLTSSEWEYVARAGSEVTHSGVNDQVDTCSMANVADRMAETVYQGWNVQACSDGFVYTAPVGSFHPNSFGVYDMLGNVFEWTDDCWTDSYDNGAPTDGSAWLQGDCSKRILRGASWFSMPQYTRFAFRDHFERGHRSATFGFRVARLLQDGVIQGASAPSGLPPTR